MEVGRPRPTAVASGQTLLMRIILSTNTPAELSLPEGRPARGVVLHPDIGGLRPLFDELGSHLAGTYGWAVCQPEPFPGREDLPVMDRIGAMGAFDDDAHLALLGAAADRLAEEGIERIAVLGFCMGGMYALKAAAGTGTPVGGRFDRAVSFYGMIRVPTDWQGAGQRNAIDLLRRAPFCPTLAIIGTADPYTPAVDVDDLEAVGATVVRYEGAEHGFVHDAGRPAHRADDAVDAWRRVADFLRTE